MSNLLTSPYFSVALIIIIVIILIMYMRKKPCSIEGMDSMKPLAKIMSCKARESYKPLTSKKAIKKEKFTEVSETESETEHPFFDQYSKNSRGNEKKKWKVQPMDADPMFANCLPCDCDSKKKN